jgi:NADH-quinone oxidoreductase subunit G
MALGDYANSRGASDMGVLPDRLPGYAPAFGRGRTGALRQDLGRRALVDAGLTARAMMEAAVAGKLKALYVVGANP